MTGSHICYSGPSALDSAPILAVLTGVKRRSANTKCDLAQLWVLPATVEPHIARRTGADASVCGQCPLRPLERAKRRAAGLSVADHGCYCRAHEAPLSVARAAKRGSYHSTDLETASRALWASGRGLRLGAYGDPAALPPWVVESLASAARSAGQGWTGYTHHRQTYPNRSAWLKPYAMASCGDAVAVASAELDAWPSFATVSGEEPHWPLWTQQRVLACPAANGAVSCSGCMACGGNNGRGKGHRRTPSHR
jgi:hypothetical protein